MLDFNDDYFRHNVSDLKGQNNAIAIAYGVQAIPASFLINQKGEFAGKNLEGENLIKELEKLLAQQ